MPAPTPQGFGPATAERLPIPDRATLTDVQRAAADAIINGPRKALFGPFIPLLRTPALMERIGATGEALRFNGSLPDRLRELACCIVARETGNQFEWQIHAPLALQAGVAAAAVDAIGDGRRPSGLADDESRVADFVFELMRRHGVCDATYADTLACLDGEASVVELTALVGYFVMVCWVMNVARTPGPAAAKAPGLAAFPR